MMFLYCANKGSIINANQFWNTLKTMTLFTINHDAIIKIRKICTLRSSKHLSLFCYCIHQTERWVYVIGYVQQEKSAQRSTYDTNYALLIHILNCILIYTHTDRSNALYSQRNMPKYIRNACPNFAHVLILAANAAQIYNYLEIGLLDNLY